MSWTCGCGGPPNDDGDSVCGECGARREEDPIAIAQYEEVFAEFAADGVLEDWEEEELARLRAELRIAAAVHDSLLAKYQLAKELLPVALEVDAATVTEFVVGTHGVIRVRVVNGGARPLKNVRVRSAIPGVALMGEHVARVVRPRGDDVFLVPLELSRPGQFALGLVVRAEDMLGKGAHFRADPLPYRVGDRASGGPQTVVTHVDASSMRVAGDPLVNVASGPASVQGGLLAETKWLALRLRPMADAEWSAWERSHDGGNRAALEQAARAEVEAKARAEAEAKARDEAEAKARAEAEAKARAEAEARAEAAAAAERQRREAAALARCKTEAEARAQREADAEAKARAQREAEAEAKARAQREAEAEAEAKARAQREAEARDRERAEAEEYERAQREREARWEAQARARARAEDEARGRAEAEARQRARAEAEAKPRAAEPVGARIATVAPGASLVRVPAGNFLMGSAEHDGAGPAHRVTISRAFELQETPVTQAQWKALMGNNPSTYGRDAYPVHNVRWFDAIAYCNALSRALGLEEAYLLTDVNGEPGGEEFSATVKWNGLACLGFRLPTEAEWEYACRAGATGARDGEFDDIAFYGNLAIQPVAKKKPNAWGLRDMLGNVCEWVWDWKADYVSGHQHDPTGPRDPPEDTWRIVRGNTCIENAEEARAAVTLRSAVVPWYQHFALGFRPARSLP